MDDQIYKNDLKSQALSKILWCFVIIVGITIAICFWIASQPDDLMFYNNIPKTFNSNSLIIAILVVSGIFFSYATFRCTLNISSDEYRIQTVIFGIQMILLISWFYLFFAKRFYKITFLLALVIFSLTLHQLFKCYANNKISFYAFIPYLIFTIILLLTNYEFLAPKNNE